MNNQTSVIESPTTIKPKSDLKKQRELKKLNKMLKRHGTARPQIEKIISNLKNKEKQINMNKNTDSWDIARGLCYDLANIVVTYATIVDTAMKIPEQYRETIGNDFWNNVKSLDSDLIVFTQKINAIRNRIPVDSKEVTEVDNLDFFTIMGNLDELRTDIQTIVTEPALEITSAISGLGKSNEQ